VTLPVAIPAGGLATRLRPVTETIPKSLVEVAGEPFAFHQLRLLHRAGIENVVFCLGYRGNQVMEVVGDGSCFGLHVDYVFDGPTLLGTGGAIRNALPYLGERFFVLYGDSYLDCDYRAVEMAFLASGKPALMTVFRNDGQFDTSNVEFDGLRLVAYSKSRKTPGMKYIDYGLGAFDRAVFAALAPDRVLDLAVLYEDLAERGLLAAFEVATRFYEIGSLGGLAELDALLKTKAVMRDVLR
jgi:NDP-sugar pyrophosphorylase family protein